jgi:hypothetical protein
LTNGPAQRNPPARGRNRPQQPVRGKLAWLGGLAHGRRPKGKQRGKGGAWPRRRGSAAANVQPRPRAGQRACARGSRGDGEHRRSAHGDRESEGAGGWSASSAAQPWWRGGKSSIEPYRRRGRSTKACLEKRRRWRSVTRKQSLGGGSPASERGGGNGGSGDERGERTTCVRLSQRERGGERVRDGGETEARTSCRGARRAGATGVHVEDGAGMRLPRSVARLCAIGRRSREGGGGARLGRGSRPSRAGRVRGARLLRLRG